MANTSQPPAPAISMIRRKNAIPGAMKKYVGDIASRNKYPVISSFHAPRRRHKFDYDSEQRFYVFISFFCFLMWS
jgi:hypothetical protein